MASRSSIPKPRHTHIERHLLFGSESCRIIYYCIKVSLNRVISNWLPFIPNVCMYIYVYVRCTRTQITLSCVYTYKHKCTQLQLSILDFHFFFLPIATMTICLQQPLSVIAVVVLCFIIATTLNLITTLITHNADDGIAPSTQLSRPRHRPPFKRHDVAFPSHRGFVLSSHRSPSSLRVLYSSFSIDSVRKVSRAREQLK